MKNSLLLIILSLFVGSKAIAQLKAGFTVSQTDGCSPLTIKFSNTTVGASSTANYYWDFGNGNTSQLMDPGTTFITVQTYTVRLIVKENGKQSEFSATVTVHPPPVASFTTDLGKVCIPEAVEFQSQSTQTDGRIDQYYWDFGDGQTFAGSTPSQRHYYQFEQRPTVSLTVTNNYGCHSTIKKEKVVEVLPALRVAFSAKDEILCNIADPVSFTNATTGPGSLSYDWDFGDGQHSGIAEPAHVFNKKGFYSVTLKATSSIGCSSTLSKTDFINIASFKSDFTVPEKICENGVAEITGNSTPMATGSAWFWDNQPIGNSNTVYLPTSVPGDHKLKLVNAFGKCSDVIEKTVAIHTNPVLNGFEAIVTPSCELPSVVQFKDTTAGAVAWKWDFDVWQWNSEPGAITQAPLHNYTYEGQKLVKLTVENSAGCTAETTKNVEFVKPYFNLIPIDVTLGYSVYDYCETGTVKFIHNSNGPEFEKIHWVFGDGGTSDEIEPVYQFNKPGRYVVYADYTTKEGCQGRAYAIDIISIWKMPVLDFEITSPTTQCGDQYFNFLATKQEFVGWSYFYEETEGQPPRYMGSTDGSSNNSFNYRFVKDGLHSVTVYATNDGCVDTLYRKDVITVLSPLVHLPPYTTTCDKIGTVNFTQQTQHGEKWVWDFGDGSTETYTTDISAISHTYAKNGTYKVKLSVTNGACTVADSILDVRVRYKLDAELSFAQTAVCKDGVVDFTLKVNGGEPETNWGFNDVSIDKWEFDDGTPFNGFNYSGSYVNIPFTWPVSGFREGKNRLRMIVTSLINRCPDTTNFATIQVKGILPDFVFNPESCLKDAVNFTDKSQLNSTTGTNYTWNFGDGQNQSGPALLNVSHKYENPGTYLVQLMVDDASGCSNSSPNRADHQVVIKGPKAEFIPSFENAPIGSLLSFFNTTNTANAGGVNYQWDFGDGTRSTEFSPGKTYNRPGNYRVILTASDPAGCSSAYEKNIVITNFNVGYTTTLEDITMNNCPPILARFSNTSINYTRIVWDFGDGVTLENENSPTHIYEKPGKYYTTLTTYGPNGVTGVYKDSIQVTIPQPSITLPVADVCIDQALELKSEIQGMTAYSWDFGDGSLVTETAGQGTHNYSVAGTYQASLVVTNERGCKTGVKLKDPIQVHPNPIVVIDPVADGICKGEGVQLKASGGQTYTWAPAAGLNNYTIPNPVATPSITTSYTVSVKDAIGCSASKSIELKIIQPMAIHVNSNNGICVGEEVQLQASGTDTYTWIGQTAGLNSTSISNPVAKPAETTTYYVVGMDKQNCFADTASVEVKVFPLPTINAGIGGTLQAGEGIQLNPVGSADIKTWNWTPADFLNCSNCKSPYALPSRDILYTLEVSTAAGCKASDTIMFKIECGAERVAIPNAFTPNGDGKNDYFVISGISNVKRLIIYNRWGTKVFDKRNFHPADQSSCWDGRVNGVEAPTETYVYFLELECLPGQTFTKKGSLIVIR